MMEDFTRVIFQNAIIKEQLAQQMYLDFAKKTSSEKLKQIFEKLAEEEELHERLFSKLDVNVVKIVNNNPLKDINLLNVKKEDLPTENVEEINKALDYAIREEQKAYEDYNLLLNHLDFGESREALKEIAHQELKHRTILQKIKLDFNGNDWTSIKVPYN